VSNLTKDQYIESWRQEIWIEQQALNELRDKARDGNATVAMYDYAELIIEKQEWLTQLRRMLCCIQTASDAQAQLAELKEVFEYEIMHWSPDRSTHPLGRTCAEAELIALKDCLKRLPASFAEEVQR
jgi:hypothetical protein